MKLCLRNFLLSLCFTLATALTAFALPTEVQVTPPDGARFLAGQKFDLRVEGRGTGPYMATLLIDGRRVAFTSGVQNTTTTDGITSAGYGGFNVRGYTNNRAGMHTLEATFSDATGTVTVRAQFEIVNPRRAENLFSALSAVKDENAITQTETAVEFIKAEEQWLQKLPTRADGNGIKNVIIMLGDGMSAAHRTAARIAKYGVTGGRPNDFLAMDKFPGTGFLVTHSLNSIVTDSSPGMACYTTGNHFANNQEGVFPARVTNAFFAPRVEYLSEYLHRVYGKTLGIVSNADIEDATPASNAVHTLNRGAGTGICDQYLDEADVTNTRRFGSGLRVLLGGGRRWFLPSGQFGSNRGNATDYPALPVDLVMAWNLPVAGALDPARDLIADFRTAGFAYADTATALRSTMAGTPDKLLGLFSYANMNVALDKLAKRRNQLIPGSNSFAVDDFRAPDQPMLEEMTDAALRTLSKNPDGFVLMVEAAHIDKQSHAMDAERAIMDTIEFDNAIAVARNFADVHGDTLVIVTSDHECSGFTIVGGLTGTITQLREAAADGAKLDPATQPERQKMIGVYEAAGFPRYQLAADGYPETLDVNGKMIIGFGGSADRYENWLTKAQPNLSVEGLPTDLRTEILGKGYLALPVDRDKDMGFFLRGQAQGRSAAVHTAGDIPLSVYASNQRVWRLFNGTTENTQVFFRIMRAVTGNF